MPSVVAELLRPRRRPPDPEGRARRPTEGTFRTERRISRARKPTHSSLFASWLMFAIIIMILVRKLSLNVLGNLGCGALSEEETRQVGLIAEAGGP